MKACMAMLLVSTLASCAIVPVTPPDLTSLLADTLFAAPARAIRAEDVFAPSSAMQAYLATRIAGRARISGARVGLFEALRDDLKLDYDASFTRNAAEAFEARSGNCLSLVILTAAFAKQLNLPVRFQSVYGFNTWSRTGDLAFFSGHINLRLDAGGATRPLGREADEPMIIDFLPPEELRGQYARSVSEQTVLAMYMNNRAAEALTLAQLDAAYWWARQAAITAPAFLAAYNTLGVIYQRHGNPKQAELAFNYALLREPSNTLALSNLARLLGEQGRVAEAQQLQQRLAQIEPYPPFYFFDQGLAAMKSGDFEGAKAWFGKELARTPYDSQLHFAMSIANLQLGELKQARKQMTLAMENSTSASSHEMYAAKLGHLKALQIH